MSKMQKVIIWLVLMLLLLSIPPARISAAPPYQTIPTRTPTPEITPTTPPTGGGGNPTPTDEPPPPPTTEPTATQIPEATATATLPFTPPPSAPGGQFAVAQPCSLEPTLQATSGRVNVRSGPGEEYAVVGAIEFLEVRPVIGRAADAPWWLTMLSDGTPGWVADESVTIQGYTGALPLVPPPSLPSGATPTKGPAWNPTPNPACTPPPSATPSRTPSPTRQPTATRLPETPTQPASTATSSAVAEAGAVAPDVINTGGAGPEVTATAVMAPTSALVSTGNPAGQAPTAAPLEADNQAAATAVPMVDWLPMIGAGLIIAGVVVYFVRRR